MNLKEEIRCADVGQGELAVCWLGQAGFLLKDGGGRQVVIDPYLTNCGERMRGFKRLSAMLLRPEELTPEYYIVTHLHFDHFDYDAIPILIRRQNPPLFLGPGSCQKQLLKMGLSPDRCIRLDRGETYSDEFITVQAVTADHGTMAPDAIGLLLEMGGHRMYFSGDTAFHESICRQVRAFEPEVAMLSVNGRFGNLNAAEGAKAAKLCGVRYAIPCHCWTFAEHGGGALDEFCEALHQEDGCLPVCFRQGEIQIIDRARCLQRGKEYA